MTSYGLPLRFKAVDIDTGEESDSTVSHIHHATGTFENVFEFGCSEKYKLFQSTGHTDANGVELFINDVVKCGSLLFKVVGIDLSTGLKAVALFEDYEITAGFTLISGGLVIGNAHMSKTELQRRSEGVRGE